MKTEKENFAKCMAALHTAFPEKLSDDEVKKRSELYWHYLNKYTPEVIRAITDRCIRELRFFPRISELLEFRAEYQKNENAKLERLEYENAPQLTHEESMKALEHIKTKVINKEAR